MADLPTVNALDEVRDQSEKTTEAIHGLDKSIFAGLDSLKSVSDGMSDTLKKMLKIDEDAARDAKIAQFQLIESLRESARLNKDSKKPTGTDIKSPSLSELLKGTGLIGLAGVLIALGGAVAGLRGWEGKAIKEINKITKTSTTIVNGMKNLRFNILKVFGLTPTGLPIRDPETGKFTKSMPVSQQIALRYQALRASVLKVFGLGVDGKPLANAQTKLPKPLQGIGQRIISITSSVTEFVGRIFSSIGSFFGKGGKLLGNIVKAIGRTLRAIPIVGQIIGFLFAAFDGILTGFNTEGPLWKKITAGIAAFTGNFWGAPLDLLKDIISWISGKLGFKGVESFLDSFSIEDLITDALTAIPDMIGKAVDWIGTLFTDPTTALKQLWEGIVGVWDGIGQFVMDNAVTPAWNWFKGLFGFSEDEAVIPEDFNPIGYLMDKVKSLMKFIYDPETGKVFGLDLSIENLMKQLPEFKLPDIKFPEIDFPNPFEGIGEKIQSLDFDSFNLGKWFGGRLDLDLGDRLKSTLSELFGGSGTQAVSGAATGSGVGSGAEVDVRSREVGAAQAQPNVTVAAPQTTSVNNTNTNVNQTTVAPASARRDRKVHRFQRTGNIDNYSRSYG
jgi:hypothetical protein